MKKTLKRALAALGFTAVGLATLTAPFVAAFAGNAPLPETGPLADGKVILVKDGHVSMYLVPTSDGHALAIDAGMDKEATALQAVLTERKLTLDAFFITHGHGDHLGACRKLGAVPVYALAEEVDIVEGRAASRGPLMRVTGKNGFGVKVTRALRDGERVDVGGKTVRVFAVPGHTQGSAAYVVEGVLFFGDTAGHATTGAVKRAPWVFSDDTAQAAASLRGLGLRLTGSDVAVFAFAHSGPMAADLGKLARVE